MEKTSATLLERLRTAADLPAWERFVELYTPLLLAWARRLGAGAADAEDLVQDVFAQLLRTLPGFTYDPKQRFRGWLRTVLHNRWATLRRARSAVLPAGAVELPEPAAPDGTTAEEEVEERRQLVARALRLLRRDFQPGTWQAFWQFVVCDRPAAAVAAELGVSVDAVYTAKSRVLRRLRQELAGLVD
jgi:RNA polymerase sigma-70 factor (ECF subfamily)